MENIIYDTIIIGSGPAGLTAGIYNIRAALKTVVIAGNQPGGQLTITTAVDNYPGFPNGIGGTKLMMDTIAQFKNLGGEVVNGNVKEVKKIADKNFEVTLEDGGIMKSRAVIVTTGAKARWLGIPGEKELVGHGISGCATCDGMFFRDKVVAVVGGGDVACEDAGFLTKFATKVFMIHRRDELRAQVAVKKKLEGNPKIEYVWNSEVVAVNDQVSDPSDKLVNIKIKNNKTNEEKVMLLDGLFIAIGHDPAIDFLKGTVDLKETGHIVVAKNSEFPTMTSVEGIFAAGDCMDDVYRQAIVAAGTGCQAALDAERWLEKEL